jgi:hypothetical protein
MIADGLDGFAVHLANHDVMLWSVSRAPLAKLQPYKRRMGWTFPWASSFRNEFKEEQAGGIEYTLPMRAASMPSGARTSGSTADPWPATRRASGRRHDEYDKRGG